MKITTLNLHYSYPSDDKDMLAIKELNGSRIVNELQFQRCTKLKQTSELGTKLSQVSNTPQKIPKGNVDLAGYLYALSTAGDMPDDIDELIRCNATVNQAREHLKNGRANIMSDLMKRPHIGRELALIRTYEIKGFHAKHVQYLYALSDFFSIGICQEHAAKNSVIYSQKCQTGEVATMIGSNDIAHSWSESNNCVMDSWAHGPAVMKKDARFDSSNADKVPIDKETGQRVLQTSNSLTEIFKNSFNDEQKIKS
ncbi:hypothetical protein ABK905_01580 [Acerihabitans sp. KWT182]|uniref:Uncharacterized protein n=1 Tax=Acerihabitans sp. KWT182 TaxID=3157919 RepID=A0AAU7QA56_9GAMM